jgi:preprotein translocase subunit Sec63
MHFLLIGMNAKGSGCQLSRVSITKFRYKATRKNKKHRSSVRKVYLIVHWILLKFGIGRLHNFYEANLILELGVSCDVAPCSLVDS